MEEQILIKGALTVISILMSALFYFFKGKITNMDEDRDKTKEEVSSLKETVGEIKGKTAVYDKMFENMHESIRKTENTLVVMSETMTDIKVMIAKTKK